MAKIIDGKAVSSRIKDELKEEVSGLRDRGVTACLAVVQVGNDPASDIYVNNKKKACAYIGIESRSYNMDVNVTQEELSDLIRRLNRDESVTGILVQLPLPAHLDGDAVIHEIAPEKDVDGFSPRNVGDMFIGRRGLLPCTPAGIVELLKRSGIGIAGKECVIVGRSNIVGKPLAVLMLRENATVTVTHSKTENLPEVTRRADILVAALGRPRYITAEYVKDGASVVDVGIHRDARNKLCGDVDFDSVSRKAGAITPVPGGVGPMTIAMLMKNCVEAVKRRESL